MFSLLADSINPTYDFGGLYRGIVVDNNDTLKAGRVKIRVMPMFVGVSDDALPWAILCDNLGGGLANTGGLFIPEIGAHVWVMFENMDHRFPVYMGGAPSVAGGVADVPVGSGTYPFNHVVRSKSGHLIELDDSPGALAIRITHAGGSKIEINNSGKITVTVVGGEEVNVTGDMAVTVSGNMDVTVGGNTTLMVTGNLDATVGGNTTLTSTGPVVISGNPILLN